MNRIFRKIIILSVLCVNNTYCNMKRLQNTEKTSSVNNTVMLEISTLDSDGNLSGRTTDYPIFSEKDNFGKLYLEKSYCFHKLV